MDHVERKETTNQTEAFLLLSPVKSALDIQVSIYTGAVHAHAHTQRGQSKARVRTM